jgi:flagellar biosynthetic protein FliP
MRSKPVRLAAVLLLLAFAAPCLAAAQPGAPAPAPLPAAASSGPAPTPATPRALSPRYRVSHTAAPTVGATPLIPATQTAEPVRIALLLTLLTLIPALAVCMTPFIRIIVVLSMIRHAFGMPETPPNQVLVILALFLTCFVMMPTFTRVNDVALNPFLSGRLTVQEALDRGSEPMREFMLRQVHDTDLKAVYEMSKQPLPERAADVGLMQLTSAFMLNELRVSFKIGFVIMLPFLLIDLVVASILLSLGMLMVPPTTLSLPIKVLMFVLIDGWSLVLEGVVGSFR